MPRPPMPSQRRVPFTGALNSTPSSVSADHADERPDEGVVPIGAVIHVHRHPQRGDDREPPT